MAQLPVKIHQRTYHISCNTGEEAHIQKCAQLVNEKIATFAPALQGLSEQGILVMGLLALADELHDLKYVPVFQQNGQPTTTAKRFLTVSLKSPVDEQVRQIIHQLCQQIETLSSRLVKESLALSEPNEKV